MNTKKRTVFVKVARATGKGGDNERWAENETCPTLNVFDMSGDVRAVVLVVEKDFRKG